MRIASRLPMSDFSAVVIFLSAALLSAGRVGAQTPAGAGVAAQERVWETLVETDQRFAAKAAEAGRKEAFLEFLADDSVVFRSGPVDAIDLYTSDAFAEEASQIAWKAHYVDVSRAGDLGLSAGPLTVFSAEGSDGFGHLVSVWRAQDGSWELMADIVVNIPGFLSLDVEPDFGDTLPLIAETADLLSPEIQGNTAQSLVDADELYGRSINFRGGQRALLRYGLENTRVYLPGMGPAVGAQAASSVYGAFLDGRLATTNPITLRNAGAYLADSQEMGYTYGTMATNDEETAEGFQASYMRLWRFSRSGEWRIAVEVLSPF